MLSVLFASHYAQRLFYRAGKSTYTTLTGWSFSGDAVFSVTWELNLRLQGISCVYTFAVRNVQDQQPGVT